ncbi:MAG: hypothetical protein V3U76_09865 [Granulosicoccus sp.]
MHLDHVTIRTRDLKTTRDFLLQVLDLEERPRPQVIQRQIPGHWLYADDQPLFHLIPSSGGGQDHAAEAIDHVGIHLDGYAGFRTKLESLGVPYSLMDLPELDERRIFFRTPGGPLLEAVFKDQV